MAINGDEIATMIGFVVVGYRVNLAGFKSDEMRYS